MLSDRSDVKEEYDIRYILTPLPQSISLTTFNIITPMHQKRPSSYQSVNALINNYLPRLVNDAKRHQRNMIDVLDEVSPVVISVPEIVDGKRRRWR